MSFISPDKLVKYGISNVQEVVYNPSYQDLYTYETDPALEGFEKGVQTNTGAIAVKTGIFTGRSPKDKYFVKDSISENTIWWDGVINRPIDQDVWEHCKNLVINQLSYMKRLYVVDTFCGTNTNSRLKVRFIVEVAWQAHFVTNMFIRPSHYELANYGEPDFVIFNGSKVTNPKWKEQGLHLNNIQIHLPDRHLLPQVPGFKARRKCAIILNKRLLYIRGPKNRYKYCCRLDNYNYI